MADQNSQTLDFLLRHSGEIAFGLDRSGTILIATPAIEPHLGVTADAAQGRMIDGLIVAADRDLVRAALGKTVEDGRPMVLQNIRCFGPGDDEVCFDLVLRPVQDKGMDLVATACPRKTQPVRSVEFEQLAAFPRFNPNPVLAFSPEGTLVYYNDAASKLARSVGKRVPDEILPLNTVRTVQSCYNQGENRLGVEVMVNGRVFNWSFYPIRSNAVIHCYGEDITERRNLEGQFLQSQKMESVGQLAAGIAHDFNNLLTIIHGQLGLIETVHIEDSLANECLGHISGAAKRASELTRQLLTFSTRHKMQRESFEMNELMTNLIKLVRRLMGEKVMVEFRPASVDTTINGDKSMIEQVLMNLAVNARDAMPDGGTISMETRVREIDVAEALSRGVKPGGYAEILVADSGVGIEENVLPRIFDPFFTTKETGKGTGLGLATVYSIVKQHNGWIDVKSESGVGTTFRVMLPSLFESKRKAHIRTADALQGGEETLLLVEDEPVLLGLMSNILRRFGYRILEAPDGPSALNIWDEQDGKIDLLLTDLVMPNGMNGRQLGDELVSRKKDLRVIYTSGYSAEVVQDHLNLTSGVNFLPKPYKPATLVKMVRSCLDGEEVGDLAFT